MGRARSAQMVSDGPIGGMLRFARPAIGVNAVGASFGAAIAPVNDAIAPVRRHQGGINLLARDKCEEISIIGSGTK